MLSSRHWFAGLPRILVLPASDLPTCQLSLTDWVRSPNTTERERFCTTGGRRTNDHQRNAQIAPPRKLLGFDFWLHAFE